MRPTHVSASPKSSLNKSIWSCRLTQVREAQRLLSELTDDVIATLDEKGRKHTTKSVIMFQTNYIHKQLELLSSLIKKESSQ